ncbi:hypothetical protein [Nevskia soli]|uniref:hypothetical protein n=1 Tax=Nevskia soli TaxID=418856 RepID=UPI0004A73A45|nr:hypothetical protein [Nevskia soli]
MLLLGAAVLGCALLHEILIRRTPWLRPLFGLDMRSRRTRPAKPAPTGEADRLWRLEDPT